MEKTAPPNVPADAAVNADSAQVSCGFWNVFGWNSDTQSDQHGVKFRCLEFLNLDILGVAETKLKPGYNLHIPGYKWIGHNRTHLHKNAHCGSGGVGFLIKESFLLNFTEEIIDATYEGILWIKLTGKNSKTVLKLCVCYLPPQGSSRAVCAEEFYDILLTQFYFYNDGQSIVCMCGDFNSRCGNLEDSIAGVDNIPDSRT